MAHADYVPPMSALMEENRNLRVELRQAKESLRDQFAMAALQGIIASLSALPLDDRSTDEALYAVNAYKFADAMLKAREEE